MSGLRYFFWLGEQALSGLFYAWPITMILLVFVVATLIVAIKKHRLTIANVVWSTLPIVVPLALLTWGVAFKQGGLDADLNTTWQAHAVYGLFIAQLPVTVFAIWRAVNARMFAAATAAFIAHYSFWTALVAEMSVTGDWL